MSSSFLASPRFLPRVMALDAASCALTGALQLGLTDTLARLTGLPAGLLTGTGVFLLAYAAVAAWVAGRQPVPRTLIGLIAVGNFGWAAGCALLMAAGPFALTGLGMAWLLAQALTVVLLGEAQWMGLRATRTPQVAAA
ncbi:hypothetical protein [Xenophilus sp. Marseille-Q4582]|uniref:hypothetical protein n=1 Tax=Xenophilus sp. Marseille-Q4582 TaxID=2866600 RepID=UPI001CE425D7|nr:hypothetical protein [Xenophilus sp. Marseille-Q4582]